MKIEKLQKSKKYTIFKTSKILPLRGQLIVDWLFKKNKKIYFEPGASYIYPNISKAMQNKKIREDMILTSKKLAIYRSDMGGYPDIEVIEQIYYKYIIKKDKTEIWRGRRAGTHEIRIVSRNTKGQFMKK